MFRCPYVCPLAVLTEDVSAGEALGSELGGVEREDG